MTIPSRSRKRLGAVAISEECLRALEIVRDADIDEGTVVNSALHLTGCDELRQYVCFKRDMSFPDPIENTAVEAIDTGIDEAGTWGRFLAELRHPPFVKNDVAVSVGVFDLSQRNFGCSVAGNGRVG